MTKRAAVFSCLGLGDGLIALVLSNNLRLNGLSVTTFHPSLGSLQGWFPNLSIRPFPNLEELLAFDQFFVIYEKSPWMKQILRECQEKYPEKTSVLNPIATKNHDYPHWEVGRFEGDRLLVDNLVCFCKEGLHLDETTRRCGIVVPEGVTPKKSPKRVVLHPTSSRPGKNWHQPRFEKVAWELEKRGYEPVFVMSEAEKKGWEAWDVPTFADFDALARFVAESGFMIGNDSGIGHLASALDLPTVTLCRTSQIAQFWGPSWAPNRVLFPPSWVPNLKGLRLRDKYWKELISVRQVLSAFEQLVAVGA